jgi:hypothetical protein
MRDVRAITLAAALAVMALGCSGSADSEPGTTTLLPPEPAVTSPFSDAAAPSIPATTVFPGFVDGPLAEVCPSSLVVQTSGLPEVTMGPLYGLLGAAPVVDVEQQRTTASLTRPDGTVEDVDLEIRSGGPAVSFRSPVAVMAEDPDVVLALTSLAAAVDARAALETTGVVTLTERSGASVVFDPATYPDIATFDDLRAAGVEVHHVTDTPVVDYLRAVGALDDTQLVDGFDGEPAAFVAAQGAIAQVGNLTVDGALLPTVPQWARPVATLAAADAGWQDYDELLVVASGDERLSDECLGRLVRVVQLAIDDYVADPTPTIELMANLRTQFNPLNRITAPVMTAGFELAIENGVFSRSADPTGATRPATLDAFLAELTGALGVGALAPADVVSDRFIDPAITSAD